MKTPHPAGIPPCESRNHNRRYDFLNPGAFLAEAIESVLAQTDSRWELLLVNDGSNDESGAIARRYESLHPSRVRYLEHPGKANLGMSASRNLGLHHAKGEFIAFLDADDVWLPEKLKEQRDLLEGCPGAGMLFGVYQFWHSWNPGCAIPDSLSQICAAPGTLAPPQMLALVCYPLGTEAAPSMSDLMARREAIERIGGFEERFRGMYEDQAFLIKIYLSTSVLLSGSCWSRYRQHKDSCCYLTNQSGGYDRVRHDYLEWLSDYLATIDVKPAVVSAVNERLWPYRHPRLHHASVLFKRVLRALGVGPLIDRFRPRRASNSMR